MGSYLYVGNYSECHKIAEKQILYLQSINYSDYELESAYMFEAVSLLGLEKYNEVEKILFVYKYLGKKIKYDKTMASLDHNNRKFYDSNSIYDTLFNNKGVCSGIAVTFRVLMNAIGIECQVICSSKHEWNVVRINGFWYHLDLTWDLYNIKYNNKLEYFLKSEKYILKDESHQFYTFYAEKEEVAIRSIYSNKYTKRLI